jgi:hypothetical protein
MMNSIRSAIVAHQAAQAKVDTTDSAQADAWTAALTAEVRAHRRVAKTPCTSDADFLLKLRHLVAHERVQAYDVGDRIMGERDHVGQAFWGLWGSAARPFTPSQRG